MFRRLILMVLFWRLHGRVGGGAISNALGNAEVVLQDGAVAEMTVSVMFGRRLSADKSITFAIVQNMLRFLYSRRLLSAK